MPRARKPVAPVEAPVEEPEVEAEQPVAPDEPTPESLPAEAEPVVSEPEPEPEVDAPVAVSHDGGVELPLAEGEVIVAQSLHDDADLYVVTNFGRKVRIDPDGNIEVVTGPPFAQEVPAIPKPPRATWHE